MSDDRRDWLPPPSEEYQRAHGWTNGEPPPTEHEPETIVWRDVCLAEWADRDVPERLWIVPDWIPREQVTGLYGASGINKTDFLVQLLMASSAGLTFLGYQMAAVPSYGLFVEDTETEIIRRASRIAARYGRRLSDFTNFRFASLVGFQETEFVTFDGARMVIGPALRHFDKTILEYGAKLATLDTAPDFFGGSEINRREVSRFVRLLDGISMTRGCGILYTAHPSVRGQASGTLDSGSTGWGAKVRARLSLHVPDGDEDEEGERKRLRQPPPETDRRILTRQQCNYAKPGVALELTCRDGFFLPVQVDSEVARATERGPVRNAACEAKFLELLADVTSQGGYLHDASNVPARYAPAVLAKRPDGKTFSRPEYERAMQRLFAAKRLRLVPHGPPSKGRVKLVEVQP